MLDYDGLQTAAVYQTVSGWQQWNVTTALITWKRGREAVGICIYFPHYYLWSYLESLINFSLQWRVCEEIWLHPHSKCGNVFVRTVCLRVFIKCCFQLMPVIMQLVISPPALNRSQLVGIKWARIALPTHTASHWAWMCLWICKTTTGLSVRVLCVQIRESPASLCQFRRNMVFRKRDGYITPSYWTHSFSGSLAGPCGLFHKRSMARILCITESKPKM